MIRRVTLVLAVALTLVGAVVPAGVRAQPADTARSEPDERGTPFFRRHDAVLAGGFVVGTIVLAQADARLARTFQDPDLQESAAMREGAQIFEFFGDPGPQLIGLSLLGLGWVARSRPIAALGLHELEAVLLAAGLVGTVKVVAGRARPYVNVDPVPNDFELLRGLRGGEYRSFPSGHTSGAFAVAASTTAETAHWVRVKGWWPGWTYVVGGTLFGGATLVGVSRMYHDNHWASDVVAGAAVGTFSGLKVVKYAYRHPQSRLERWLLPLSVVPGADGGVVMSWSLPIGPAPAR